ncbi:hypothetical protein P7K49_006116 [Saguinus oedipus]|uniref:Uncharacterized protein n=1 Tax=Saguinus oedipus TaxID=9490 RepID=A0ABQ9W1G5_SAGOE|nr:hypothetical protein P7K49_006116 [Saguinus oedipus]
MAVDITLLFRASVKTVKTRNKALGVAVGGGVDGSRDELFRRSPRPKGDFSSRAREVVSWLLWKRRLEEGTDLRQGPRAPNRTPSRKCCVKRVAPRRTVELASADSFWGKEQPYFEEGGRILGNGFLLRRRGLGSEEDAAQKSLSGKCTGGFVKS